jgi:tetratricopeptide (TPR) repeat protein
LAAEQCGKDLEINPAWGWPHGVLALIALERKQTDSALAEAREGASLDPSNNYILEILAGVEAHAGMRKEALGMVETLKEHAKTEYVCLYELGAIYTALGDTDTAFQYFNKAYEDRDVRSQSGRGSASDVLAFRSALPPSGTRSGLSGVDLLAEAHSMSGNSTGRFMIEWKRYPVEKSPRGGSHAYTIPHV